MIRWLRRALTAARTAFLRGSRPTRQTFFISTPVAMIHEKRLFLVERNIGLPVRIAYLALIGWGFFVPSVGLVEQSEMLYPDVVERVRALFVVYSILNLAFAALLLGAPRGRFRLIQYAVFTMALLDALFLAALMLVENVLPFWIFVGLIVRNAASISDAIFQVLLNFCVSVLYLAAGFLNFKMVAIDALVSDAPQESVETIVLRFVFLLIMGVCCTSVQTLYDRNEQIVRERREFDARNERLRGIGTLTAEIAHQLKNPLGIINNAAYSIVKHADEPELVRSSGELIRSEIERSDSIVFALMDFARLNEGRIEKLNVASEARDALKSTLSSDIFPHVSVSFESSRPEPTLLMQRGHLTEILENLLVNAREAVGDHGSIGVSVRYDDAANVEIRVDDDGPGIPAEIRERVFETFFTTKEHGTGLGLGIVKKNVGLYGGRILIRENSAGGATFVAQFPSRI